MNYRVWISKDIDSFVTAWTSDGPCFETCAFFEDVDEEGLGLLMKFMQHNGCAIAIMPALTQEEA